MSQRWLQAGILFALFSAAVLSQANEYRSAGGGGGGSPPGGSNGNVQINNSGSFGAYGGTTCADGFVTALDANGGSTCATPVPGAANAYNTIQEEGADLAQRNKVNVIGDYVTCVDNAGLTKTDCTFVTPTPIATPTAYAAYETVQEEGVGVTARRKLNVIGAYATCADNAGTSATDCTFVTPTPQAATAPGGADTQVQFNNAGAFGGSANFTWDNTNARVQWQNLGGNPGTGAFDTTITMPAAPVGIPRGVYHHVNTQGTDADGPVALTIDFNSGYTGAGTTAALDFTNVVAGTDTTFNIGTGGGLGGNRGVYGAARPASGVGNSMAVYGEARNSTSRAVGVVGQSTGAQAGERIGVLGVAGGSTEATDWKNVGGYFSVGASMITGKNVSAAVVADNGSTAGNRIFQGYDNGVLVFEIADVTGTAVNGFQFNGNATGTNPYLAVTGDTNLGLDVVLKGTGDFRTQHMAGRGTAPTIGGSCGTTPSISGTDLAGAVTVGSGTPASCIITFNATWSAPPHCFLNDQNRVSTTARFSATTTTTATITVSSTEASDVIDYFCVTG